MSDICQGHGAFPGSRAAGPDHSHALSSGRASVSLYSAVPQSTPSLTTVPETASLVYRLCHIIITLLYRTIEPSPPLPASVPVCLELSVAPFRLSEYLARVRALSSFRGTLNGLVRL